MLVREEEGFKIVLPCESCRLKVEEGEACQQLEKLQTDAVKGQQKMAV